jgi:YrbI family 3-deoxy-D-manno-octulosonate 8-phosphate phosphatase
MNATVQKRLLEVRLLAMDVDGTLTDGTLFYTEEGHAMKSFFVRDGMGIVLLHRIGIRTALISSETSPILTTRAKKLGIHHTFLGCVHKDLVLKELAQKENLSLEQIAYIGDDINDISALKIAGISCCPSDAHPDVKGIVDYIAPSPGGKGAVRDICDAILALKNQVSANLWSDK